MFNLLTILEDEWLPDHGPATLREDPESGQVLHAVRVIHGSYNGGTIVYARACMKIQILQKKSDLNCIHAQQSYSGGML